MTPQMRIGVILERWPVPVESHDWTLNCKAIEYCIHQESYIMDEHCYV